jgi:hypothetical protein
MSDISDFPAGTLPPGRRVSITGRLLPQPLLELLEGQSRILFHEERQRHREQAVLAGIAVLGSRITLGLVGVSGSKYRPNLRDFTEDENALERATS